MSDLAEEQVLPTILLLNKLGRITSGYLQTMENPDVVLVEDNEDEAEMSLMGLKKIVPSPTVLLMTDGEQAVTKLTGLAEVRPKVVLLDLKLPKIHGLEVLAALKSDPVTKNIPVLVLTSSDHPSDIARAKSLGADEYLCKPVDWKKYVELVCDRTAHHLTARECVDSAVKRTPA